MAQITRFDGNLKPFADDALGTERTVFGAETQDDTLDANINADFWRGWGIVGVNGLPTKQDFNAFAYTSTALTAHLYQTGVSPWNDEQEYFTGSITNVGGVLYKAIQDNIGEEPSADDGSNWESITGTSYTLPESDETTVGGVEKATQAEAESESLNKNITADNAKHTKGSAKAWVNFNGTGVIAIRESYNVSSLTDDGTGRYRVNMTNPLVNENGVVLTNHCSQNTYSYSTSMTKGVMNSAGVAHVMGQNSAANTFLDQVYMQVAIFGDLA